MNNEKLKTIIQTADGFTEPLTAPANLGESIRQRAKHKKNTVRFSAAAALFMLASLGAVFFAAYNKPDAVSMQEKLTQLQTQIETLQNQVQSLKEAQLQQYTETREFYTAASKPLDPVEKFNRQIDDVAFAFLYQGDRLYQEMNLNDAALDMYQQVIKISPESKWAQTAQLKISKIKNLKSKI